MILSVALALGFLCAAPLASALPANSGKVPDHLPKRPIPGNRIATYLDDSKPIEVRVEDALKRMTLEEKVAVCHAQSKFCSPGVQRLSLIHI